MRRGTFLLLAFIFAGSFFIFTGLRAANTDIAINEIGAYPASGHEWIEIWNKGNEPVDLFGWKFWENNTNHSISSSTCRGAQLCAPTTVVQPNEYAVIAQDANQFLLDYPIFTAPVFDSSWSSLSESGEEIGLKDNQGAGIEQFTYVAAPNFSLERRDPFLADFTGSNWQEHSSGNTIGQINTVFCTGETCLAPAPTLTDPDAPPGRLYSDWTTLKINEFISDPETGNEWVELYNTSTTTIDLTGGLICDATSATSSCKSPTGTIPGNGWFFFDLATTRYLNNDGDSIILKSPDGTILDQIIYGNNGASAPAKNQVLARQIDGNDTDNDSDWAISTQPTPGAANIIVIPTPPSSSGSNGGDGGNTGNSTPTSPVVTTPAPTTATEPVYATSTSPLVLNELYPNPPGADTTDEFIEIKNISSQTINLTGWKLADTQKTFTLSGSIGPNELIAWMRPTTGISLNNTAKEEVKLLNPTGAIADLISYPSAKQGQSLNRDTAGHWLWSEEPTKEEENIIELTADTEDETGIAWKIVAPTLAAPGELLTFNAADSADPRGGLLTFSWDFGNGATFAGEQVNYTFNTVGSYTVSVVALSTQGTTSKKELKVTVQEGAVSGSGEVILNEIFANPDGTDSKEFVELFNSTNQTLDLSGWSIRTKANKKFTVPAHTSIAPQSYLVFFKTATALSINNTGDKISFVSPTNEVRDIVSVGKSFAGSSYALINSEWQWTNVVTPGKLNAASGQVLGEKITASKPATATKAKTTKTTTVRRTTSKTTPLYSLTIAEARLQEKSARVKTTGVVTVLPAVFGTQYFYITDGSAGIQVYSSKKAFPKLAVGDLVSVTGQISSANNAPRINIKQPADVTKLASNQPLVPLALGLEEIEESNLGNLIAVKGEITAAKTNFIYIDDGQTEAQVYFKKNTGINKKDFKEGVNVQIAGIVEQTKTGWQIWPRGKDDIVIIGISEEEATKQTELHEAESKQTTQNYLSATAGGLTTLLIAALMKLRGSAIGEVLKKSIVALLGIIRKK